MYFIIIYERYGKDTLTFRNKSINKRLEFKLITYNIQTNIQFAVEYCDEMLLFLNIIIKHFKLNYN